MKTKIKLHVLLSGLFMGLAISASATPSSDPPAVVNSSMAVRSESGSYPVALYKSISIPLSGAAKFASVANPGVADILVRGRELYVIGKQLGSTNVVVWDGAGNAFARFDVEVTHDLETLKVKLHELLPDENIKVFSAQNQLVLAGQVSSAAHMDTALQLAAGFLPVLIPNQSDGQGASTAVASRQAKSDCDENCKKAKVINMMQVGGANQVMLKVTVAEMSRTVMRGLDSHLSIMNFGSHLQGGGTAGGASFPNALDVNNNNSLTPTLLTAPHLGPPLTFFQPNTPVINSTGAFLSYLSGTTLIDAILDVSKTNGLARILSEPTLTTMTGQEAQFLSGGEFPIPVPQGGGSNSTTIEFKEFGVSVKFVPVVLESGRINLAIKVSVSDLSTNNRVVLQGGSSNSTFVIPSLTKRSASSTVELGDGQTIGIAGLINDNMQSSIQRFPGLGDIPLLGALFSSQQYQSGQTELVMFVTPRLAQPIASKQIKLPTDSYVPPGDMDFYLFGRLQGHGDSKSDNSASGNASVAQPPQGSFGHDVSSAQ